MKKKKSASLDRRSFLKNSLTGGGLILSNPAKLFFSALFTTYMQRAMGQTNPTASNDFRLLNIMLLGGAARWMWDLPLKPNATNTYVNNPFVGTVLDNNNDPIYNTVTHSKFNGIRMPSMWSGNIPTVGNGSTAMANLADNMLMMRGVSFLLDSHDLCKTMQLAPENGHSLTGLVADNATTGVPAISVRDKIVYSSAKGISNVHLSRFSAPNPLSKALEPFTGSSNLKEISNQQVGDAIDNLINLMAQSAGVKHEYLPVTTLEKNNAKALMKRTFGDLQQAYDALHAKYEDLASRSISDSSYFLAGLENKVLAGSTTDERYGVVAGFDYDGSNLNNVFTSSTHTRDLTTGMAVSEFMLLNNLTSSINMSADGLHNIQFDSLYDVGAGTSSPSNRAVGFDLHQSGSIFTMLHHTKYFRALSACLYEMIGKLKSVTLANGKNMFDHTVISVCSDFNRSPRNDQSGSDHGWQGSNNTFFSGMIQQCEMVGNITHHTSSTHSGTWGKAAPIAENNNTELIVGNACSTVAAMLEIDSPSPNSHSVVSKDPVTGNVNVVLPRGVNV